MKNRKLMAAALVLALNAPLALAQSGHELFQQALRKERTAGDCAQAIPIYEKVAREAKQDRELAAKALVRAGECHEKLGQDAARKAYQRVVSEFAEQNEQVAIARARLAVLTPSVRREGSAVARLVWSGPGVDVMGAPSPDERHLSFVDWSTGDLAIRDLVTGQNRRLTNKGTWMQNDEYAEFSIISPDGRSIAYAWFNGIFYELRVMNLENPAPRVLYRNEQTTYVQPASWSPDGKKLATVISRLDGSNQIALVSVADGSVLPLKSLDWRYPGKVSFSPDGRYLAYDFPPSEDDLKRDVYVLSADGSSESRVVEHAANDTVVGWSPAGDGLIFGSGRTGRLDLWRVPVKNGKAAGPAEMAKSDFADEPFRIAMTPKGSFYYSTGGGMRDVALARVDAEKSNFSEAGRPMADRYLGRNYGASWSPDGRQLAYFSRRGPAGPLGTVLVLRDVASGNERELRTNLRMPRAPHSQVSWHPDGTSLLVAARDLKGRSGVFNVEIANGNVTRLVEENRFQYRYAAWLPDGHRFVYLAPEEEFGSAIRVRDARSKEQVTLHTSSHIHAWALSPDGQYLAVSTADSMSPAARMANVLRLLPTDGSAAREVARLTQNEEFTAVAFTSDGKHLLLSKTEEYVEGVNPAYKDRVWRVSSQGGEPVLTPMRLESRQLVSLQFHPDGEQVVFNVVEDGGAEIWVLENFLPKTQVASTSAPRSNQSR